MSLGSSCSGRCSFTKLTPIFLPCCSISSQLSTLQRNLASARDELASTVRSKNADRASFERKEASLKTDITKLKDELERQRKAASETRTEQRSVRTVSHSPFLPRSLFA